MPQSLFSEPRKSHWVWYCGTPPQLIVERRASSPVLPGGDARPSIALSNLSFIASLTPANFIVQLLKFAECRNADIVST
jgi:hypothetical protein